MLYAAGAKTPDESRRCVRLRGERVIAGRLRTSWSPIVERAKETASRLGSAHRSTKTPRPTIGNQASDDDEIVAEVASGEPLNELSFDCRSST